MSHSALELIVLENTMDALISLETTTSKARGILIVECITALLVFHKAGERLPSPLPVLIPCYGTDVFSDDDPIIEGFYKSSLAFYLLIN